MAKRVGLVEHLGGNRIFFTIDAAVQTLGRASESRRDGEDLEVQ
jgi:hypothetical protein